MQKDLLLNEYRLRQQINSKEPHKKVKSTSNETIIKRKRGKKEKRKRQIEFKSNSNPKHAFQMKSLIYKE